VLFDDDSPEQVIARLREHGVSEIVVKDGETMCTATEGQGVLRIPVDVVEQIDTTAAGDSFNAAYIAARLAGQEQEPAVRHAQGLAARVIRFRGAIIPR
jgi:2-dehydro-3-deoxygluconokinase